MGDKFTFMMIFCLSVPLEYVMIPEISDYDIELLPGGLAVSQRSNHERSRGTNQGSVFMLPGKYDVHN